MQSSTRLPHLNSESARRTCRSVRNNGPSVYQYKFYIECAKIVKIGLSGPTID